MILRMMPHVKTIDQKSKPAKKLNELPYKHIFFEYDNKYICRSNIRNIMPLRRKTLEFCDFTY